MDEELTLTIDRRYGTKFWKNKKKQLHKLDGPAIEWLNGEKEWWRNGMRHREDGPAFIYANGDKEWWINHVNFKTKEEYFDALSDEAKIKCLFSEDFLNG
jgi:hypothetical protein